MKQAEEQQTPPQLDDQQVADYLLHNPDFFIHNAALVEQLRVPHPVRGTVSLVEWHMARARQHIGELEQGINVLLEQADSNQRLFYRLLKLQVQLASASSLQALLEQLHKWARAIGLSGASIRLFTDRWRLHAPLDFVDLALDRQQFTQLRLQRLVNERHYLGTLNGQELSLLLPPNYKPVGSVALSLLGDDADLGVLLFTSRNPQHYQPGQGTQLLQEIALLLPDLLQRWLERQP